ncbi:MAG TPA: thiamine pyrophosphate-dependent enzyme [Chloroflexota bacterium]|jgi:thiamine pyrophosphate-dependent acetolactate synthase large subunit-like protein
MTVDQRRVQLDQLTVPTARPTQPEWGSDVVAEMLRRLGIEYIALNPGASYRGLHDSIVNYNANQAPGLILCNHEEVAVGVAHGYAKLRGRAMAAAIHSNVGLMHATMAIFNAFEDRQPMLIVGGNGPMDATLRRPWIDWVHTTHNQGELVREFVKWEHQPTSIAATPEALLRAWQTAHIEPTGPVYVDLDAGLQEQRIDAHAAPDLPRPQDFPVPRPPAPATEQIEQAARWLVEAEFPVVLPGRIAQTQQAWDDLVALAELLGAAVLFERRGNASFPTRHPLSQSGFGRESNEVLEQADVVLALERNDPAGTLRGALAPAGGAGRSGRASFVWPKLINVSLEPLLVSSWVADYQELAPAGLPILATPHETVAALVPEVHRLLRDNPAAQRRVEQRTEAHRARRARLEAAWATTRAEVWDKQPVSITRVVAELRSALEDRYADAVLAYMPTSWPNGVWDFDQPGSYLGGDGGAGVGAGPPLTVGAALAAQDSGRAVVGVVGDGGMLMTPTALWTAAHHRIPALLVVVNNQSYFNDEEHQERVARTRGRPHENRWVGQRMAEPPVDFAALARSLGVEGFGPVVEPDLVSSAMRGAVGALDEGRPALVEVRVAPR